MLFGEREPENKAGRASGHAGGVAFYFLSCLAGLLTFLTMKKVRRKKREKILMIGEDKKEKNIIACTENKVTNFYYLFSQVTLTLRCLTLARAVYL